MLRLFCPGTALLLATARRGSSVVGPAGWKGLLLDFECHPRNSYDRRRQVAAIWVNLLADRPNRCEPGEVLFVRVLERLVPLFHSQESKI